MDKKKFGFYFLVILVILLTAKLYSIAQNFLPAVATACVLAYLFNPVAAWLRKKLKSRALVSLVVVLLYLIIIVLPLTMIVISVQNQVQHFLDQNSFQQIQEQARVTLARIADWLHLNFAGSDPRDIFPQLFSGAQKSFTMLGSKLILGITNFVLYVVISAFILFYLINDSDKVIGALHAYLPLKHENIDKLLGDMARDTRSLVLGQLIIALMQGTLAALGLLFVGVSGVILWGLVMTVLSFIPFLGSFIIWFPVAIALLVQGKFVSGIGLLVWGVVVVSFSDNLVRPKLTSALGKIHPVTVLIGVFIGIAEWGLIGLVLGPLLISVLLMLVKILREEYIEE